MPDTDRTTASDADERFDDWPVGGRARYADWQVRRATPRDQGSTADELAEEYGAALDDEGVEWIGVTGGGGSAGPFLYTPQESALYEGELDAENERVILRGASRHDVEADSLGDRIEEIGEEHGWEWLSAFARDHLGADADAERPFARRDGEFERRNVGETDDYDLAFYGSHTVEDETGRVHTLERFFDVYRDGDSGVDRVAVTEEYLVAEPPAAERRAGDAERIAENRREVDLPADVGTGGDAADVASFLEAWHDERVGLRAAP